MPNPNMLTSEYRLLRRVGRGGMGEVWEAVRIKSADIVVPCAIKLLHGDFTETTRERKLFFDEARIATQLDNGRIVKIIDIGTTRDNRPFLVMERVDGVDLRSYVEAAKAASRGPLELEVVTYIVGEVLVALAYAHGRAVGGVDGGIMHSDVTPGNIMISSTGEVKLTDFGIARFAATAGPMSRAIGTPRYMSPEQLCGEPQRETDIYGLGVVLHELLEGERFLDGLTPDQFRGRVLTGPPPDLKRAGVPKWLDDLRRRMIATDPRARPQASEAWSVILEHSPRHAGGAAALARGYAELIGGRRSGVTQLHVEGYFDGGGRSEDNSAEVEVEPTQLLPAVAEGRESVTATGPSVAVAKPMDLRWLVVACGVMALMLGCVTIVLFVKMLDEPGEIAVVERESPQVVAVAPQREPAPLPEAAPQIQPEPSPEPEPPTVAEPEPEPELVAEPAAVEEPEPEPAAAEPARASKAKPAKLPKIGVVFLVETNQEGQLKVGRKLVPVKNRSAYAELAPGNYSISWQPKGQSDWQLHGRVKIDDISPGRYKVRLDDGKVAEVGKL